MACFQIAIGARPSRAQQLPNRQAADNRREPSVVCALLRPGTAALRHVLLAVLGLAGLWANPGLAQQFNRIGYVMTIGECYTPSAASQLGGAADLEVDMNNAVAWANVAMQNSGTGIYVVNTGYFETAEADTGSLHSLLSEFYTWSDVENFYSTNGCGVLQCLGIGTDDAGLSYECWYPGTVSAVYLSANCFTHELGRNTCCEQGDGFGGEGLVTIMLFNYCGGNNLAYFSNPGAYYNGISFWAIRVRIAARDPWPMKATMPGNSP